MVSNLRLLVFEIDICSTGCLTLKLAGFWEAIFGEMKFAVSNFLSNEDLSISYET